MQAERDGEKAEKEGEKKRRRLTDGGPSTAGPDDEEKNDNHAKGACDDVGDVGERAIVANEGDGTFWVDTDGGDGWVGGVPLEDGGVVML